MNVKPRNVGEWNGWDTMYTFTRIFAKENSTLNIASTMFYTNRSNQINSAAQDWGIWKRWALDHENFNQFKSELVQSIDLYNKKVIEETKTKPIEPVEQEKKVEEVKKEDPKFEDKAKKSTSKK